MDMRFLKIFANCAISAWTIAGLAASAEAANRLVVVELFTSQGCSSCPPANANLIELSKRPDVLTLSFSVTYWDYLGWKDIFGKPEFTERQAVYEPALGEQGPFTPQMVVDGRASNVGFRLSEVEELIAAASADANPSIDFDAGKVRIGGGKAPSNGADVWLVRYDPKIVSVPVTRGENSGATLPHTHVVHALERLGTWTGDVSSFAIASAGAGLHTAVLVQVRRGGPILSAKSD
jgi:hypothetical protein